MRSQRPKTIPYEIHLMILEYFLSDKDIYSVRKNRAPRPPRTSVSEWIGFSLVCRAWKTRINALAFRHLSVLYRNLAQLRDLSFLVPRTSHLPTMLAPLHLSTLDYIRDLTLIMEATDYLPEVISILPNLPHLSNLTIDIGFGGWELDLGDPIHPRYTISQVRHLGLSLSTDTAWEIGRKNMGVRWILSCFPSVEHLYLNLGWLDDTDPDLNPPHSLPPKLISLASTGWFPGLFGRQLPVPTLRFFEVWYPIDDTICPFADYHGNTLEGLRLMHMSSNDNLFWDEVIPKFSSLRYLSVGNSDARYFPLERINSQHLCHFEFTPDFNNSSEEMPGVVKFITEDCPNLRVVTYHSDVPLMPMRDLGIAGLLDVIQKPRLIASALQVSYLLFESSCALVYYNASHITHMQFPVLVGRTPYLPTCPSLLL